MIHLGKFSENRYGTDLEFLKFLSNGKYIIGAQFGYTGSLLIYRDKFLYTHLDRYTYAIKFGYRFFTPGVLLKVTFGQNLRKLEGWRIDLNRYFGEFELGFYYTKLENKINAGFNFAIPLYPSAYSKSRSLKIRPSRLFRWEYRYRVYSNSLAEYSTSESLENIILPVYPSHIAKMLVKQK